MKRAVLAVHVQMQYYHSCLIKHRINVDVTSRPCINAMRPLGCWISIYSTVNGQQMPWSNCTDDCLV